MYKLKVAEAVGKGHPDKICDQISDLILDEILKQDKNARVAVETFASNDLVVIGGEVKTNAVYNPSLIAKKFLFEMGYKTQDLKIIVNINKQSNEINKAVEKDKVCAGDQGVVFGYANYNVGTNHMPLSFYFANKILKELENEKQANNRLIRYSDSKCLVELNESNKIEKIVVSIQHDKNVDKKELHNEIWDVIYNSVPMETKTKVLINPSGSFVKGGIEADTGLTGRKIIVDSYGDASRHGGGAYSGKDLSKVDRSGAYFARWLAKNIVLKKWAKEIEIKITFAIGEEYPVSIDYDVFGEKHEELRIRLFLENIKSEYSVEKMIEKMSGDYNFANLACFGHFGKNSFPWEKEMEDKNE